MDNKFKVGDKLELVENLANYKKGDIFEVVPPEKMYNKMVWIEEGQVLCYDACPAGKIDVNDVCNSECFVLYKDNTRTEYTTKHYDTYYQLTEKDIEEGKIRVDAYWVAKQWKIGSRDDSGALFHNLKTIARFGEKNSVEREIKALYNQTKALARVYGVELE